MVHDHAQNANFGRVGKWFLADGLSEPGSKLKAEKARSADARQGPARAADYRDKAPPRNRRRSRWNGRGMARVGMGMAARGAGFGGVGKSGVDLLIRRSKDRVFTSTLTHTEKLGKNLVRPSLRIQFVF